MAFAEGGWEVSFGKENCAGQEGGGEEVGPPPAPTLALAQTAG